MREHIITKQMTRQADQRVKRLGARPALVKLSKIEPDLIDYVDRGMDRIWKELERYQTTEEYQCRLNATILRVIVAALDAQRTAHCLRAVEMALPLPKKPEDELDEGPRVSAEHLDAVEALYWPMGRDRVMRELHAVEPELHRFIVRVYGAVRDALGEHDLPESLKELVAEQLMSMTVICIQAVRGKAKS